MIDSHFPDFQFPTHLKAAVFKRKLHYFLGRACIAQALEKLGHPRVQVETNPDRSPKWPSGILGALTHTDRWVMTAVAASGHFLGIGIDSEEISRATPIEKIAQSFADEQEKQLMHYANLPLRTWLFLIFSAKESLFKALYPIKREYFGFEHARVVSISPDQRVELPFSGSFFIQLTHPKNGFLQGTAFKGLYQVSQSQVHTWIGIHQEAASPPMEETL